MGLLPDGALPAHASADASPTHDPHVGNVKTQEADFTLSQAMRTWAFWMIVLSDHHPCRRLQFDHRSLRTDYGLEGRL